MTGWLRPALAALLAAAWPAFAMAAMDSADLAACAARNTATGSPVEAGALSRGVNMTDALTPGVPMQTVADDMRAVRQAGLRHVRLPIRPSLVLRWPAAGAASADARRLDAVVCAALDQHLTVILDAHPEDDLALRDTAAADVVDRLASAWDRLAARYAVVSPGLMVFEALNEPGLTDAGRWAAAQNTLLAHIRRAAPRHTVVLTAAPDSTAVALAALVPVPDRNVVYAFHFYSPMVFTHQGAEWAKPDYSSVRGLSYPATAANVASVRSGALPAFAPALAEYQAGYRHADEDGTAIEAEIGEAAAWGFRNHVKLMVTEFGVYRDADPASRSAWLHDVRATLEAGHIGWTVWEYRGGFGISDGLAAHCGTAGSFRTVLGLCPQNAGDASGHE